MKCIIKENQKITIYSTLIFLCLTLFLSCSFSKLNNSFNLNNDYYKQSFAQNNRNMFDQYLKSDSKDYVKAGFIALNVLESSNNRNEKNYYKNAYLDINNYNRILIQIEEENSFFEKKFGSDSKEYKIKQHINNINLNRINKIRNILANDKKC